jgi:methylase of polypeptide subunit release factors
MKSDAVAEFGDFQTPRVLANLCCEVLLQQSVRVASILEPTCGQGSLLIAALEKFPSASAAVGMDINLSHLKVARQLLANRHQERRAALVNADFFKTDWRRLLGALAAPVLVIGNPPWVTNAALGSLGSANLPKKSNFNSFRGVDAITGKSNFDISESMLITLLHALRGRTASLGMLCKTAVARKALFHAWKHHLKPKRAAVYRIDAQRFFGAAVDACFFVCEMSGDEGANECGVFEDLRDSSQASTIGFIDGHVVADVKAYRELRHLRGSSPVRWRSGIKHDCSKVMEFRLESGRLVNGLGEAVDLEEEYLFPMLKSSDVARSNGPRIRRWMLVTQRKMGEDTNVIQATAPKTWKYLMEHAERLDARASSIYKKRPRFSVFGVGDYSFSPYKLAVSGFYKSLAFAEIGLHQGKPVVLDDTAYFLPCETREQAVTLAALLNSPQAKRFYGAFLFMDAKRPVTVDVLAQLNLASLAKDLGLEQTFRRLFDNGVGSVKQKTLFV